jgi:hypothetical protein
MVADRETGAANPVLVRIRFVEAAAPGELILMSFRDPEPRVAAVSALALEALTSPPDDRRSESLLVLKVPAGGPKDAPRRREAQAWFDAPETQDVPPIQLGVDGGLLKWRPGRAVLEVPADRMDALLPAVVDFAFYEHELHRLEEEVAADWPTVQADVPLMSRVGRAELAREAEVATQGTATALRRLRCARLEPGLITPPASLTEAGRTLGERLREEADTETRLETLDGHIEVYEYIYELACQRISDYRHFRREYVVEVVIAVILAIEVVIVAAEMYLTYME